MKDVVHELTELFANLVMGSEIGPRHLYYPFLDSLAFLADYQSRPLHTPGRPRLAERRLLKIGDFLAELASRGPRAQRNFPEACRVVAERASDSMPGTKPVYPSVGGRRPSSWQT